MDEVFKIFIDRLKKGEEETIEEMVPPNFMEIHESELSFKQPIKIIGKAFLSQDTFVLQLNLSTIVTMICAICNQETDVPIDVKNLYFTESLDEIREGIFDFRELVRESLLLELPIVAECNQGSCKEREHMAKYLKKNQGEGVQTPFADL